MCKIKKEIYFPEIEIHDDNWLKYALLYKSGIVSMIPEYEKKYFSDKHRRIQEDTDFFDYFNDFKHFRNVNNNFRGFILDLNEMESENNLNSKYSTLHDCFIRQEKSVEILNGKMTQSLENDLIKLGYGTKIRSQFFVSRSLATLYMGMMAESIASRDNLKVTSTHARYGEYQSMLKVLEIHGYRETPDIVIQNQKFKEIVIDQSLPREIKDISVVRIIQLRNSGKYQKALSHYNELLLEIDENIGDENNLAELLVELTGKRSTLNTLIQSMFGSEIFSYTVSSLIPIPANPLAGIGASYVITKSIPHMGKLLRLPDITPKYKQIKSVSYLKSEWSNIDM